MPVRRRHIESVKFEEIYDDNPDLSHIGTFSDRWQEGAIDREELGERGRDEYRYFIPANKAYALDDYNHYKRIIRGGSWFVGIRAVAVIVIPSRGTRGSHGITQKISSPGLWGIEVSGDAADEDYKNEVKAEELDELGGMLSELGFSEVEIRSAFAKARLEIAGKHDTGLFEDDLRLERGEDI